jgi:hypothetical protein
MRRSIHQSKTILAQDGEAGRACLKSSNRLANAAERFEIVQAAERQYDRLNSHAPKDPARNQTATDRMRTGDFAPLMARRLTKDQWAKLKRAFVFGHSLGAISQTTGVPRGTLTAYAARHDWSRERIPGTEILRKEKDK